jgi:hypothetical protein
MNYLTIYVVVALAVGFIIGFLNGKATGFAKGWSASFERCKEYINHFLKNRDAIHCLSNCGKRWNENTLYDAQLLRIGKKAYEKELAKAVEAENIKAAENAKKLVDCSKCHINSGGNKCAEASPVPVNCVTFIEVEEDLLNGGPDA